MLLATSVGGEAAAQTSPPNAEVSCAVEMAPMRDRVLLATEVYRPKTGAKHPVIIQRGPYNGHRTNFSNCDDPIMSSMAAKGYVVLKQDARGTYRSQGVFRPIVQEGDDGYDAVEWAARQPWSTGKVGMMGGSYHGMTQWQAAIKRPPHLVTIVPDIAPTNFDDAWPYQTGAFGQFVVQTWTGILGADQLWRKLTREGASKEKIDGEINRYLKQLSPAVLAPSRGGFPLSANPIFNNEFSPWYNTWISHPTLDDHWRAANVEDKYKTLSLPVLSTGSFYDLFLYGTVDGFAGMQQNAATPEARANARMIIAGGGHARGTNAYVGGLMFGPENRIPEDAVVRWFDYWLKGIDNGVMKEPAAKLYVMLPPDQGSIGSGFWVNGDSFPLPGTRTAKYYLGGGRANGVAGGGTLGLTPATSAGSDQFQYDPSNPVPTIGGNNCCSPDLIPGGAFDQRSVEIRPDVLVYSTEALTEAVPVIGNVSVTLTASSSAPNTAFTAKLVDVHLDGYAQIITDGVLVTGPTSPNTPATYTIRMGATGTVFKPGHKIRLEISSSNYPRFNAHANTNEPLATAKNPTIATQTILWGSDTQTWLNLPVAPITVPTVASR